MRTLKFTLVAALALMWGASTASATSVDVIWVGSGTDVTTVAPNAVGIVGDIMMTINAPDGAVGGIGAGIELSADATTTLSFTAGGNFLGATGFIPIGAPAPVGNPHYENILAQGYLYLFPPPPPGIPNTGVAVKIGTVTVSAGAWGGTATVSASGAGDDILGFGAVSVLGNFSFGLGAVNVPEPTTASLLGLGLVGLTVAGRRRRS